MLDRFSLSKSAVAIVPAVLDADHSGVTVDRRGFESLVFKLLAGVGGITFSGTNKVEVIMEDSDDASTWAAADAADVNLGDGVTLGAGGIVKSFIAAHAAAAAYQFGYVGSKRYARLRLDFSGTHGTGTAFAAVADLGDPAVAPVA